MSEVIKLTRKDFVSNQTVRWCPGCGDYAILAQMQKVLPDLGISREKIVFISGIGCSSRFPYYMNAYGIHSIHGRAPTLATGLKIANPDLSVWVITGDGDGLSIGGNHLLHILRRNLDINIILFNNRIYGLTKGQYSPTSLPGHKTKTSPMGSLEQSFNPMSVAIGAEATFVARTIDTNVKHMAETLRRAAEHKGTSFVEIYQNCVIFNDNAWSYATDASEKDENVLELEHGQPMIFGKNRDKGIRLHELQPEVVSLDVVAREDLLVHNEFATEPSLAYLLSRMRRPEFPEPIGVFRSVEKPIYEEGMMNQVEEAIRRKGGGDLTKLYHAAETWETLPQPEPVEDGRQWVTVDAPGMGYLDEEYVGVSFRGERTSGPDTEHSLIADTLANLKPHRPLTAHVGISVAEAVEKLKALNVGFMALVDDEGKLAGVFTEGDIFRKVACKVADLSQARVKDYMTSRVTTLKADAKIAHALHLMSIHKFRHVIIVDDQGKPTGVLSFRAVVRYIEGSFLTQSKN
ncbi:MAG: CBS domain-containing protein [Chloroflexi bacterium]|nr:CBS domain-containing protein [Chloroflexota bacterium]